MASCCCCCIGHKRTRDQDWAVERGECSVKLLVIIIVIGLDFTPLCVWVQALAEVRVTKPLYTQEPNVCWMKIIVCVAECFKEGLTST